MYSSGEAFRNASTARRAASASSVEAREAGLFECGLPKTAVARAAPGAPGAATRRTARRPCSRGRRGPARRVGRTRGRAGSRVRRPRVPIGACVRIRRLGHPFGDHHLPILGSPRPAVRDLGSSRSAALAECCKVLDRRDDVVGAGQRAGEARQLVARARRRARPCSRASSGGPAGRAQKPTKIVPWPDASRTRCCAGRSCRSGPGRSGRRATPAACGSSSAAVGLAPTDDRLLGLDRQALPGRRIVLPLLEQEDRAALAGRAGGHDRRPPSPRPASGSPSRR